MFAFSPSIMEWNQVFVTPSGYFALTYDNALLIMAYAVAYRLSKEAAFRQTAEETAAYILGR